jgi:hypothetical protein
MAKKARRRLEETEAVVSFEFPTFDERGFVRHELEQTVATGFAFALAVLLAVLSFALDRVIAPTGQAILQVALPVLLSISVVIASPILWARLRPAASEYRRGDWASLILLEMFGWLGLWFLLTDVFFRT